VDEPQSGDGSFQDPIEGDDSPLGAPRDSDPEGLRESHVFPERRDGFAGSELLVAEHPQEVLHRLLDGDPLQLGDRCRVHLRRRAFFLNVERLFFKAVARTSFAAMSYAGRPPLDPWLDACIDRAIEDMRSEQYDEEFRSLPPALSEDQAFYLAFAQKTGIEMGLSRLACLALNSLPQESRLAFQAVGIEGKTIHRYVAEGNGPPERIRSLLRTVALSVLLVLEDGHLDHPGGDPDGI
jgi:hypothetical protein